MRVNNDRLVLSPIPYPLSPTPFLSLLLMTGGALRHRRGLGVGAVLHHLVVASGAVAVEGELVGEHEIGMEQKWPFMVRDADGFWRMPPDRPSIPQLWSVRARKRMEG